MSLWFARRHHAVGVQGQKRTWQLGGITTVQCSSDDYRVPLRRIITVARAALGHENVERYMGDALRPDDRIRELDLLSRELYSQSRFAESLVNLEQAVGLIETHRGPTHPSLGSPLNNVAMLYERLGRNREAEGAFRRSLQVMAESGRSYELASTHRSLAKLLLRQGDGSEAAIQLQEARRCIAPVRSEHPDLAGFIDGEIASQLTSKNCHAEALPFQKAALEALIEAFGSENEHVGTTLNNLAVNLMELNRPDEAEPFFRESLQAMSATVRPDDPRIRDTVGMLAMHYSERGRYSDEAGVREWYIRICADSVPDSEPFLADMLMELGRSLRQIGEYGKSVSAYKRAMSDESNREQIVAGSNGIAMAYQRQGRYVDAEALYQKAIETTREIHGIGSVSETSLLGNLADVLTLQERTDEAVHLLNEALAIREKELGPNHVSVARTLHTLARLRYSLGDTSVDTEAMLRRAIRIKEAELGPNHLEVAATISLLASVLSDQDRVQDAREAYLRTLNIRRNALGNRHPDVGMTFHNIGMHYADSGRLEEARQFLGQSLKIFEHAHGHSHPEVALSLASLVNVLTRLGESEEAERLQARIETIPGWENIDVPIVFATDRSPGSEPGLFTALRLGDRTDLAIGSATVRAPKGTVLNRASRVADSVGFLDRAGGFQSQAAAMGIVRAETSGVKSHLESVVNERLARATRFPGQGFIFVHGFNNSFEEAVQRAAMISFDLDFDGPAFVFAWSSQSKAWRYRSDRRRARLAVPFLVETLQRIGRLLPAMRLNIIAHSTGAEIAVNAVDMLWMEHAQVAPPLMGELILAHADIKPTTLARTLPSISALGLGVTSYSSSEDKAMSLSRWLRGAAKRVGSHPARLQGVDCIDVTGLGVRRDLNHNVFVRNPIVFGDIARLLSTGERPPEQRSKHFAKVTDSTGSHWVYRRRDRRDD